ncbi:MAG: hypothetical protein RJA09_2357 [Pseudomonadota bacterium]|jgi:uncharacterized protein
MKYLLVLVVLVVGFWWWRHNRDAERSERAQAPRPPAPPTNTGPSPMVTCRHCGLHLPHNEAVQGALGPYCSPNHQKLAEG